MYFCNNISAKNGNKCFYYRKSQSCTSIMS